MKIKIIPTVLIGFALISAMNSCQEYKVKQEEKVGKIKEHLQEIEFENVFVPVDNKINLEEIEKTPNKR